jgi:hypothetical protein
MNRIKIYLFWVVVAAAWSSCYRGNEYDVTDNEPDQEPDTTTITYYGNLSLGTIKLPADTIFSTVEEDPASQLVSYSMESYMDQIPLPTFSLFWDPVLPNEGKIAEGTYTGCCSALMDDSSLVTIQNWVLQGRNTPLLLDSLMYHPYIADNVSINVSNVVEAVKTETIGPGVVWITDQATVQLDGIMVNLVNGQTKAISGTFVCNFGRMGM